MTVTFLTPAFVIYSLFVIWPMVRTFYTSLFRWRGLSANMTFVGLANFFRAFSDPKFINAVLNTLTFVALQIPLLLLLSLFFALMLSQSVAGNRLHRIVYFFPNIMPLVAIAAIWSALYNPLNGPINAIFKLVGLENLATQPWLGDPDTALPALIVVEIWRQIGFYTVLFLAGIQRIPPSLIEAAKVDGASDFTIGTRIILPLINEVLKIGTVFVVINSLNVFVTPQLMTRGGPSRHTQTIGLYIYEQGFQNSDFGYASALGAIFFVIVFLITAVALRIMRRDTLEY